MLRSWTGDGWPAPCGAGRPSQTLSGEQAMASNEKREPEGSPEVVRDFQAGGDVGQQGHSAFGAGHDQGLRHNDERLAGRGRNPGREDGSFLDAPADEAQGAGPGTVRGLTPPDKDDVGG
jgi:hypothetical protein